MLFHTPKCYYCSTIPEGMSHVGSRRPSAYPPTDTSFYHKGTNLSDNSNSLKHFYSQLFIPLHTRLFPCQFFRNPFCKQFPRSLLVKRYRSNRSKRHLRKQRPLSLFSHQEPTLPSISNNRQFDYRIFSCLHRTKCPRQSS